MVDVTMSMDEYLSLLNGMNAEMPSRENDSMQSSVSMPKKRKTSAYSRRYKANFRKIAPRYKLKSGKWKKNGFRSAVRLAHKMSKK